MAEDDINPQKTDATGFLRSVTNASGPNYLGSTEVVDRLVRDFASAVIDRFEKVAAGRMVPNDASAEDQVLCQQMAEIFTGHVPGYTPVEDWTDGPLAGYIRETCSDTIQPEDDESVVAQAFAILALLIYDQIRNGTDEQAAGEKINEGIRSLACLLLGVAEHDAGLL